MLNVRGCMNAQEYRAYREEQAYKKKQNRQSIRKNAPMSDICVTHSMIRPKAKENPSKGLIRATLKGYKYHFGTRDTTYRAL